MSCLVLAACTKRNPAVCCSTPPECEEIGFDEITPCEGLRVCIEGSCESPTCTTSAECSDPTPYCVNMVCAAMCTGDPDCVGVSGLPYCAPDGGCVACVDSAQCTDPAAAVCDDSSHQCRQCVDDSECASGVCLGTEGTCSPETDVVYVATGGSDSGECPSGSPCRTIQFGLTKVTAQRRVLRLVDAEFVVPDGTTIDRSAYVDTPSTRISRTSTGPILTVTAGAIVTIEGIRVENPSSVPAITVDLQSSLVLANVDIDVIISPGAVVSVDGQSSLRILRSHLRGLGVQCIGFSGLEVDDSFMERANVATVGAISGDFCTPAVIRHTRFDRTRILLTRSELQLENSQITNATADPAVLLNQGRLGTAIRFNTFANSPGSGAALSCSGLTGVPGVISSNIFAWQSAAPISAVTTCDMRNSLYDETASSTPGSDNVVGVPFSAIFVDPGASDFHLQTASPAREAAEAETDVVDDLEHNPRPMPAGSVPDLGAYELP